MFALIVICELLCIMTALAIIYYRKFRNISTQYKLKQARYRDILGASARNVADHQLQIESLQVELESFQQFREMYLELSSEYKTLFRLQTHLEQKLEFTLNNEVFKKFSQTISDMHTQRQQLQSELQILEQACEEIASQAGAGDLQADELIEVINQSTQQISDSMPLLEEGLSMQADAMTHLQAQIMELDIDEEEKQSLVSAIEGFESQWNSVKAALADFRQENKELQNKLQEIMGDKDKTSGNTSEIEQIRRKFIELERSQQQVEKDYDNIEKDYEELNKKLKTKLIPKN